MQFVETFRLGPCPAPSGHKDHWKALRRPAILLNATGHLLDGRAR